MRLIAIEEHFQAAAADGSMEVSRFSVLGAHNPMLVHDPQLEDLGAGRLADMDRAGIDVQVLSQTSRMKNDVSIAVAARVNDELAEAIALHPDRFAGFATLAFADPKASAVELERAVTSLGLKGVLVNGIQEGGRFLDDPCFWPVFETAAALGVPVYLHPAETPHAVFNAYYSGLKSGLAELLATSGWGWHVETGLHALRLIIAGIFVRFPTLQFVIGHMARRSHSSWFVRRINSPRSRACPSPWLTTSSRISTSRPAACSPIRPCCASCKSLVPTG